MTAAGRVARNTESRPASSRRRQASDPGSGRDPRRSCGRRGPGGEGPRSTAPSTRGAPTSTSTSTSPGAPRAPSTSSTGSSSSTSMAPCSPNGSGPCPVQHTSATTSHAAAGRQPAHRRKCHRCPDTRTVTDVLMQFRHPCPETSQRLGGPVAWEDRGKNCAEKYSAELHRTLLKPVCRCCERA